MSYGKKDFATRRQESNADWRSQVSTIYSGSSQYNALLSSSASNQKTHRSTSAINEFSYRTVDSSAKKKIFDSIRFPPLPQAALLPNLSTELFRPVAEQMNQLTSRRATMKSGESFAAMQFLEAAFSTAVDKAAELRNSTNEHGLYIYAQAKPDGSNDEEIEYMRTVIVENLSSLREECTELLEEMAPFSEQRIDAMIEAEDSNRNSNSTMNNNTTALLLELKASLLQRVGTLKHEIAETTLVLSTLTEYTEATINYPMDKICKLDGILTDWNDYTKLQEKIVCSNRSLNFASYMSSFGLPVCDAVFEFLYSTKACANTLLIRDYSFAAGELKVILDFFDLQHRRMRLRNKEQQQQQQPQQQQPQQEQEQQQQQQFQSVYRSTHRLIIHSCQLEDQDCHALSKKLAKFVNLDTLNLSHNRISYAGIASVASAIFERGMDLRCIRLDQNNINTEGAAVIAEMLHKLPLLEVLSISHNPIGDLGLFYILKNTMNRQRIAYSTLTKPAKQRSVLIDFSSGENYSDDDSTVVSGSPQQQQPLDLMEATKLNKFKSTAFDRRIESEQERIHKRKLQHRCFFADFFRYPNNFALASSETPAAAAEDALTAADMSYAAAAFYFVPESEEDADAAAGGSGGLRDEFGDRWINSEEDEFFMDTRSEYSDDDTLYHSSAGGDTDAAATAAAVMSQALRATSSVLSKRAFVKKVYPKIVLLFIKVRIKLVALNMFLRLLRTPCILSSLNVAACGLTVASVTTVAHALRSNRNIVALDVSHNPLFLSTLHSCRIFAAFLENSSLRTLCISCCGIRDLGFTEILRAAGACRTLRNLEASGNSIGPTGANWVASACKTFYVDAMTITGGFHSSAPFAKHSSAVGSPAEDFEFLMEELEEQKRAAAVGIYDNDFDDLDENASFHDADDFEGEEEEDHEKEDGDEEEEEGEEEDDATATASAATDLHADGSDAYSAASGGSRAAAAATKKKRVRMNLRGTAIAESANEDTDGTGSVGRFSQNELDNDDDEEEDAEGKGDPTERSLAARRRINAL